MITIEKLLEFKKVQEHSMTINGAIERFQAINQIFEDYCKYKSITKDQFYNSLMENEDDS